MIVKDMMPSFELYQTANLDDALELADRFGADGWVMAGGNDSLAWFKDRAKRPQAVIDITGIAELNGVRETADGVEIGAVTTLSEIERHPLIGEKFRILADAARRVASPQIRNNGTIGGNVSQDARCWYYRYGLPCYRAGGHRPGSGRARGGDAVAQRRRRAGRESGGLLHRARGRHHAHDRARAERDTDRDPDPEHLGRRKVLLREGRGPADLGLSAGQRRLGAGDQRRRGRAGAGRLRRGRVHAAAARRGRRRGPRQGGGRPAGAARRAVGDPRRPAAQLQPLQGAADAEPGEA